jgi:membrane-bound ClpP family serine protease
MAREVDSGAVGDSNERRPPAETAAARLRLAARHGVSALDAVAGSHRELDGLVVERLLGGILLIAALLAAGVRRNALGWLVPLLLAIIVAGSLESRTLENAALGGRLVFLVYVELCIVRQVLHEENVGWDTVAGAAAGYVILAVIWGDVFVLRPARAASASRRRSSASSTSPS